MSGVAPLAVFFDGTRTTGTAARPFHDYLFSWTFGDPAGGATWARGSLAGVASKNAASGPVAAHVFERPGTYSVCMTVFDGANTEQVATTITVSDPDVVFNTPSSRTLCVSSSGVPVPGFDGCPAGANVTGIQSSDFDAAINATAGNGALYKRILFRAGQTFTTSTFAFLRASGPGLIGSYGSGPKPVVNGNSGKVWWGTDDHSNPDFGDWRIVGLNFTGTSRSTVDAFRPLGPFQNMTILNNEIRNTAIAIHLPPAQLGVLNAVPYTVPVAGDPLLSRWSRLAVVDNIIESVDNYALLGDINTLAFMGNRVNDNVNPGGHLVRTGFSRNSVFSHNELGPVSTGNRLTVRAFGNFAGGNNTYRPNTAWTENVVVSFNRILGTGFTIRAINPDDDGRIRNVIVENNLLRAEAGSTATSLATEAGDITIRNNLMDLSGAWQYHGVQLYKSSATPAGINANVSILNNSVFSSTATGSAYSFAQIIGGSPANLRVQNNLSYLPGLTGLMEDLAGSPGANSVISNNTDAQSIRTCNPGFATMPPAQPSHWRPTSGPCAIDQGATVPVFTDFFGAPRSGTPDLGAVNP